MLEGCRVDGEVAGVSRRRMSEERRGDVVGCGRRRGVKVEQIVESRVEMRAVVVGESVEKKARSVVLYVVMMLRCTSVKIMVAQAQVRSVD